MLEFIKLFLERLLGINTEEAPKELPKVETTMKDVTPITFETAKKTILREGMSGPLVEFLQAQLKRLGYFEGAILGNFKSLTGQALEDFQRAEGLVVDRVVGPKTWAKLETAKPKTAKPVGKIPWMVEARKMLGKKETDPKFNKEMSSKWSMVGLNLKTISESWAAWCGLFVAVSLGAAGVQWQKDGALARNWGKYGIDINYKVDGIPEGAEVWINHKANCKSSSSNHVAFANGDCTAAHVAKSGAVVGLLGGNHSNSVNVSNFKASTICAVRWPNDSRYPKPPRVTKNRNCTGSGSTGGSTL